LCGGMVAEGESGVDGRVALGCRCVTLSTVLWRIARESMACLVVDGELSGAAGCDWRSS